MRNLVASTAIALSLAAPAFAEAHMSGAFVSSVETEALRASDILGTRLYVSEGEVDPAAGQSTDWEDVGEVSDIIVGSEGGIDAILVDIGGFLGIGERTVGVNMDELQFVSDSASADSFFIVLQSDRAMLESAPEFDNDFQMGRTGGMTGAGLGNGAAAVPDVQGTGVTTQSAATTDLATEPDVADTAEADVEPIAGGGNPTLDPGAAAGGMAATGMLTAPRMEMEGYETVEYDALTADDVTGARVYGINEEDIGEIGELVISSDGRLQDAVIDMGGFLGLGERLVAVPFDQMQVMRSENDVRVYIDATEEQLTNMPEYEG